MKNGNKKILAGGATALTLATLIHYPKHDDIVEQDYTRGNMIETISTYGDTSSVSASSSSVLTTSSTTIQPNL